MEESKREFIEKEIHHQVNYFLSKPRILEVCNFGNSLGLLSTDNV